MGDSDKVVPIEEVLDKRDPNNARVHDERNKEAIKKSFERFGAFRSLAMDKDGVIRAGNGSLEAAKEAGIQKVRIVKGNRDELIVVQRDDIEGEDAMAYAIADNRSSDLSQFDLTVLSDQLGSLTEIEIGDLGFTDEDIGEISDELKPPKEKPEKDIVVPHLFNLLIECEDEAAQEKLFNELTEQGYKCRPLSL